MLVFLIALQFKTSAVDYGSTDPNVSDIVPECGAAGDVQKKISLLNNPSAVIGELFPHTATAAAPLGGYCATSSAAMSQCSGGSGNADTIPGGRRQSKLVLVASLVSKTPNLGGTYVCVYVCMSMYVCVHISYICRGGGGGGGGAVLKQMIFYVRMPSRP